jgi:aminoglycoside phosphotransferase (APT) family kinase protein
MGLPHSPGTLDVEPSIATVLARKMRKRGAGAYRPRTEADVLPLLQRFVGLQPGFERHQVDQVARLAGGASKEQFRFDVTGPDGQAQRLVLRMDPPESVVETSRVREFQALRAFEPVVPVPHAMWMDAEGEHFGTPALITSFVRGVTKPAGAPGGNVSGLGINVGAEWREVLAEPFMRHMVAIHGFDWRNAELQAYAVPDADPQQAARRQIDWWTQVWLEDAVDPDPMIPAVEGWLRDHMPACSDFVFCHSDYRTGNYLIDEDKRSISSILDWELAHLGDFHDDVAWVTCKVFGHQDESGQFLVSGLMPREQFLERYTQLSGRTIDPKTLHFYEVLNSYKVCVIMLASAYRTAVEAHNHQNVLQTWLVPCGHVFAAEVCRLIDQGPRA